MKQVKLVCLMGSAALFAFATPSFSQSSDMAKDKAVDMVKDQAKGMIKKKVKGQTGDMGAKAIDVGSDMMDRKSMKDVAIDAARDKPKPSIKDQAISGGMMNDAGSMTTDETLKAGKIIIKGGSVQDAGTAIAKDRAKNKLRNKASKMLSKPIKTETASQPQATPAATVNCPSGTTAQPNGTCMITGDFNPS